MDTKGWYQKDPHSKWHYFVIADGHSVAGPALCGRVETWRPGPDDLINTTHYSWQNCDRCKRQRRIAFPREPDR